MAVTATAQQDDMLDAICWRAGHHRRGRGRAGARSQSRPERNRADRGGTPVLLPDPPTGATSTLDTTNLWD
jgi:phage tail protein X